MAVSGLPSGHVVGSSVSGPASAIESGLEMETTPITFERAQVTEAEISAFRHAIRGDHTRGIPPTFATVFRWGEFRWLDRMKVDMRNLLHTEQEYHYLAPVESGDIPKITTKLKQLKERAGMKFITLESEVICRSQLILRAYTTFVVRDTPKEKA